MTFPQDWLLRVHSFLALSLFLTAKTYLLNVHVYYLLLVTKYLVSMWRNQWKAIYLVFICPTKMATRLRSRDQNKYHAYKLTVSIYIQLLWLNYQHCYSSYKISFVIGMRMRYTVQWKIFTSEFWKLVLGFIISRS